MFDLIPVLSSVVALLGASLALSAVVAWPS